MMCPASRYRRIFWLRCAPANVHSVCCNFEENATGLHDDTLFAFVRIDSAVLHEGKKTADVRVSRY
jgi:hypothetical protein